MELLDGFKFNFKFNFKVALKFKKLKANAILIYVKIIGAWLSKKEETEKEYSI